MFTKEIYETILTSEVADRLFSNINDSNTLDKSFLTTLRALLHKRLPSDETVWLRCNRINRHDWPIQDISQASDSDVMNYIVPTQPQRSRQHSITIVYTSEHETGTDILEIVKANTGEGKRYMSSFKRRDDLQVFYARKMKALFYTDDSERYTVIFAEKLGIKQFHALQMVIPRYFPWLFIDAPPNEMEMALLKSLGNKSASEYESLIENITKGLNIRSEIIRSKLAGFETVHERSQMEDIRREITVLQASYEREITALRELGKKIDVQMYTLAGLECSINKQSEDSELMAYFICNKNLTLIEARGTSIEFIVHGYADIFNEDVFDRYVANHDGFLYNNIPPSASVSKTHLERFYRTIFNEGKYKLRLCAGFSADIQNGITPISGYAFPAESKTYLPNLHIQQHGCIGGYAGRFAEYLQRKDYVGAIDQAVVSTRNLNFTDSVVMGKLAQKLLGASIKCIEKPDGTLLSPLQAINEMEGVQSNADANTINE